MSSAAIPESAIDAAPYYLPVGDEVEIFLSAYEQRLPVLLKGPTGCGKTRFVEYMTGACSGGKVRRRRGAL
jgi:nitric oxide reductase NorQ protein